MASAALLGLVSYTWKGEFKEKSIRSPIFVGGLEATTGITVLEGPPSSIAGKLAAS